MTEVRRVLAFDQDEDFLGTASRLLGQAGIQFRAVREPSQVMTEVSGFEPQLVLLDRTAPGTAFAEAAEQLRESTIPVAFVLREPGDGELVRAVRARAVDVMSKPFSEAHVHRVGALLEELARRPKGELLTWEEQVARNFLDLAKRRNLRGSLVVNRGTPFEGRVVLKDGALLRAAYGPLTGVDAVREILQLEDGLYELDATLDPPVQTLPQRADQLVPGESSELRPRVLVVDDEPDIVVLLAKHLVGAGFDAVTAADGQAALDLALATPFDLILADLSMPRMDGWEMLRMLKADHRTSEVPVVIISAHDDYRETLRAARAGAYDYLAKIGRSEVIVAAALRAIAPRLEAYFHLLVKHPVEVRTQAIGLQWTLRALARMKATGVLSLRDDWGTYRVEVKDGQPVTATSEVQHRQVTGLAAFVRMMVATAAHGTFQFGPVADGGPGALALGVEELIRRTCETLNGAEARANEQRLASASEFEVDTELYELFLRIAPPKKVAFARALVGRQMTLAELAKALGVPGPQASDWFNELLRRGVIKRAARGARAPLATTRPEAQDRRKTLLAQIRAELGEMPWVSIAEALDFSLVSRLDHEMNFNELLQFARSRGYDWRDVYTVLWKLTVKGFCVRVALGADIGPPNLAKGPDVDDKQLHAWMEWARRAQPVWRSALGTAAN